LTSTVWTDLARSDCATTSPRAAVITPSRAIVSPFFPMSISPANALFDVQNGSSRSFGYVGR
jgi:hypothetical protein